jgi:protein-tyrosine phosphatase
MEEIGLNTSKHRSREVNREILEMADLILTMEQGHKEAIQLEFPQVAGRIFLLTELSRTPLDVADPIGLALEDYRDTAQEIREYILAGFDRIVELSQNPAQG